MEGRNLVCGGAQLMLLSDRKFEICFYHILKQFMEGSILFSGFRLRFLRWWGSVSVIVGQDVFVCEYKVALVESRWLVERNWTCSCFRWSVTRVFVAHIFETIIELFLLHERTKAIKWFGWGEAFLFCLVWPVARVFLARICEEGSFVFEVAWHARLLFSMISD